MLEYYGQRASDGGFIVSEGTAISLTGRGWLGAPGLYSDQQIEGWKKITAAVHAKGGRMFSQLWHTGRSSRVEMTGGQMPVSASVNRSYWEDTSHVVSAPSGWVKPSPHRALDIAEINHSALLVRLRTMRPALAHKTTRRDTRTGFVRCEQHPAGSDPGEEDHQEPSQEPEHFGVHADLGREFKNDGLSTR